MKGDDYMQGRHFWVHFWCGMIVGGIIGGRACWGLFDSAWACLGLAIIIASTFAFAVGYCGDSLWRWLLENW